MSDVNTLRLASPELTQERLDQFVRYQRSMLGELASVNVGDWAGRFAFAHARAATECGLDTLTLQRVRALVADFCGRRSALMTVKQRVADAERAHAKKATAKTEALLERAKKELPALESLEALERRYGALAIALLRARELELVTLHRDLARLEGAGGHVHGSAS